MNSASSLNRCFYWRLRCEVCTGQCYQAMQGPRPHGEEPGILSHRFAAGRRSCTKICLRSGYAAGAALRILWFPGAAIVSRPRQRSELFDCCTMYYWFHLVSRFNFWTFDWFHWRVWFHCVGLTNRSMESKVDAGNRHVWILWFTDWRSSKSIGDVGRCLGWSSHASLNSRCKEHRNIGQDEWRSNDTIKKELHYFLHYHEMNELNDLNDLNEVKLQPQVFALRSLGASFNTIRWCPVSTRVTGRIEQINWWKSKQLPVAAAHCAATSNRLCWHMSMFAACLHIQWLAGNDQLSSILPPSQRLRMLLSLVGDDAWQILANPLLSQTFFDLSILSLGFPTEDLPGAVGTMGPGLKLDQWKKPKFYNCRSAFVLLTSFALVHIFFTYFKLHSLWMPMINEVQPTETQSGLSQMERNYLCRTRSSLPHLSISINWGLLHTCRNFGANRVARVAAGHTQRHPARGVWQAQNRVLMTKV